MEAATETRPIASTMRAMKPGDVEYFPAKQYNSVRNTQYFTLKPEIVSGWEFDVTLEKAQNGEVITKVTRTA